MTKRSAASVTLVLALAVLVAPARTADHRDAPSISEDGRADLLDVFAFVNPNNGNVVFAGTINPFSVGGSPGVAFAPDVLYEFKIDNTGDTVEDLVIQWTFTPTVPSPQRFTVRGPEKPRTPGPTSIRLDSAPAATGPATGTVVSSSGPVVKAFAGERDDPFFFDLVWTFRLIGALPGGLLERPAGIDFFAGLNCSVFAVEVPAASLRGTTGNIIRFWATTSRARTTTRSATPLLADTHAGSFVQIERMGLPVVNTVLIPSRLKDAFNRNVPMNDNRVFREFAIGNLLALNGDRTYSQSLVDAVFFPDVLTLDLGRTDGFLNGRRPQDDVIDAVLAAATRERVVTDNVSRNDVAFLADFPFFAPSHGPELAVPPRNK